MAAPAGSRLASSWIDSGDGAMVRGTAVRRAVRSMVVVRLSAPASSRVGEPSSPGTASACTGTTTPTARVFEAETSSGAPSRSRVVTRVATGTSLVPSKTRTSNGYTPEEGSVATSFEVGAPVVTGRLTTMAPSAAVSSPTGRGLTLKIMGPGASPSATASRVARLATFWWSSPPTVAPAGSPVAEIATWNTASGPTQFVWRRRVSVIGSAPPVDWASARLAVHPQVVVSTRASATARRRTDGRRRRVGALTPPVRRRGGVRARPARWARSGTPGARRATTPAGWPPGC